MTAIAIVAACFLVLYLITTMWRVLLLGIGAITIAVIVMGVQDLLKTFSG